MLQIQRLIALFFFTFNGACAGTVIADLPDRSVKNLSGPVCNEDDEDALGAAACRERFKDFITRCVASTVRIQAFKYSPKNGVEVYFGTGVVLDEGGLVLTADHVVKGADFLTVTVRRIKESGDTLHIVDHWSYPARTVYAAAKKDVALLLPAYDQDEARMITMPLRTGFAQMVGETVWHFGQTSGISEGSTSKWPASSADTGPVMQTEIPVALGDSGGPVVTRDGRLIGIVLSKGEGEEARFMYYMPIDHALHALLPWLEKTRVREIKIRE